VAEAVLDVCIWIHDAEWRGYSINYGITIRASATLPALPQYQHTIIVGSSYGIAGSSDEISLVLR
jgi:hypothetical protein